ncbi:hypothetical protein [Actinocatenispora rupis]|uniref:Uncharacterized protein n=1 Tax=Actinocatenispora rupis TaxID=519421 RepID=A0A8J3J595_9ACTN|nr:hypothetical protein [Actinocatenispora rupis]GID12385.1 hypothetical protein Aru02nite_32740 [Actinocatenispora rupis]
MPAWERFRVRLLGPVEVRNGATFHTVRGVPAALLSILALPAGRRRHVTALHRMLWDGRVTRNAVQGQVSKLRKCGLDVRHDDGYYWLAGMSGDDVDAAYFQQRVGELGGDVSADEAHALLELWRDDPRVLHDRLDAGFWQPVFRARDALVERIAAVPDAVRARIGALPDFLDMFPGDPALGALRAGPDPIARPEAKRILVVDDEHGDDIAMMLFRYDCTVVRGIAEWKRLWAAGPLRFDLAIVDRHLGSAVDESGFAILDALRGSPFPRMLITADRQAGDMSDLLDRYDLATVFHKHDGGAPLSDLLDTVRRLVDEQ